MVWLVGNLRMVRNLWMVGNIKLVWMVRGLWLVRRFILVRMVGSLGLQLTVGNLRSQRVVRGQQLVGLVGD